MDISANQRTENIPPDPVGSQQRATQPPAASGSIPVPGEETRDSEQEDAMSAENRAVNNDPKTPSEESTSDERYYLGKRLLRVAVLAVLYFLLEIVVKGVTVVQFVFFAWKKQPSVRLQRLGAMIARYMESLWLYCTFATDDAPWPYRPWPRVGEELQN